MARKRSRLLGRATWPNGRFNGKRRLGAERGWHVPWASLTKWRPFRLWLDGSRTLRWLRRVRFVLSGNTDQWGKARGASLRHPSGVALHHRVQTGSRGDPFAPSRLTCNLFNEGALADGDLTQARVLRRVSSRKVAHACCWQLLCAGLSRQFNRFEYICLRVRNSNFPKSCRVHTVPRAKRGLMRNVAIVGFGVVLILSPGRYKPTIITEKTSGQRGAS